MLRYWILGSSLLLCSCHHRVPVLGNAENAEPFRYEFTGALDETVWEKGRYTFDGNGCVVDPGEVENGPESVILWIRKLARQEKERFYTSGQIATHRLFSYGTFTVSMRSPIPPGTVASFFLMNPWKKEHWLHKEIDIEFLGKSRHTVQFNTHYFYADQGSAMGRPRVWEVPFDYGEDYHEYAITWRPGRVEWHVDGKKAFETGENVPDEPLNMIMNFWVPDPKDSWAAGWVGVFDETRLPAKAEYRWVKYEPYP